MAIEDDINSALHSNQKAEKYYDRSTGTGCIIRDQTDRDYFKPSLDKYKVLPGAFLHQDLIAPNPAYNISPESDSNLTKDEIKQINHDGVPAVGTLAFTPSKVKFLFSGDAAFDLQDPELNKLVLYSHDANSCDQRAICLKDKTDGSIKGWQGPCIWDQGGGDITPTDLVGAGGWPMGNPYYNIPYANGDGNGGGTGYHCAWNYEKTKEYGVNNYKQAVSKIDMPGQLADYVTEYEYFRYIEYNGNWWSRNGLNGWIPVLEAWYSAAQKEKNLQKCDPHQKLDSFGWVDRMGAMISLQNGFYWNRDKLGFDKGDVETSRHWWGWNEIPFDSTRALTPGCWDCLAIVMPLNPYGDWNYPYSSLSDVQKKYIKDLVDKHYDLKFKYSNDIAILQQQWFSNKCAKLVCVGVIKYANL